MEPIGLVIPCPLPLAHCPLPLVPLDPRAGPMGPFRNIYAKLHKYTQTMFQIEPSRTDPGSTPTSGNWKKADYFPPRGLRGIMSFKRRVPATSRQYKNINIQIGLLIDIVIKSLLDCYWIARVFTNWTITHCWACPSRPKHQTKPARPLRPHEPRLC